MIAIGELHYDPARNRVYKYGRALSLGPMSLRLLVFLMEHADTSFQIDDLIVRLWGAQVLPDERARAVVRSQVRRIRTVIEDNSGPWLVSEGGGLGYGLWLDPPLRRACELATPA